MATVTQSTQEVTPSPSTHRPPGQRALKRMGDRVFSGLSTGSGIIILVILAMVAGFLLMQALPALKTAAPQAQVLMLTMSEAEADLGAALRGGACGYLLKTADNLELTQAIERAMRGVSSFSAEMAGKLASAFRQEAEVAAPPPPDPFASLSPREREILDFIARGDSNKQIARELGIAETTVKIHVQHLLRKLNLDSRVQAAVLVTQQRGSGSN